MNVYNLPAAFAKALRSWDLILPLYQLFVRLHGVLGAVLATTLLEECDSSREHTEKIQWDIAGTEGLET